MRPYFLFRGRACSPMKLVKMVMLIQGFPVIGVDAIEATPALKERASFDQLYSFATRNIEFLLRLIAVLVGFDSKEVLGKVGPNSTEGVYGPDVGFE